MRIDEKIQRPQIIPVPLTLPWPDIIGYGYSKRHHRRERVVELIMNKILL